MSMALTNLVPMAPSTYSAWIDDTAKSPRAEIRFSTLGHNEAYDELLEVWEKCRRADWDGFGAKAVEPETFRIAYQILKSLPLGFPRPSLGAEPDGHITLEWYKSPSRTVSVSVDPENSLHFAALFGRNKSYGTLDFFDTVPLELIHLVREL